MDRQDPLPVRRSVVAGLIAAAAVGGLLLLVRPFIFSFAPPISDANYTVGSAAAIKNGPALVEIVLGEPHGWPGEVRRDDDLISLAVVASAVGQDAFAVVDAWSPTNDCALTLGADRLTDCNGDTWTFDGVPIDPADPSLTAFPTTINGGAVVADFTRAASSVP
ncbi:MAG TPA: hypothetical protein VL687_04630 [Methylomirabilota bacterium]|nr:hypothetical protein [Methylomirabilota bacterium]